MERFAFFYELWSDPPVYVIASGVTMDDGLALAVGHAAGRAGHVLVRPSWLMETHAAQVATVDRWLGATHPNLRLTAMARTAEEADAWGVLGVSALHAHNLAFIDEAIFRPMIGERKLYDAVHTAQTGVFKRHELAYDVPNLALITYVPWPGGEPVEAVAARYRRLAYVNLGHGGRGILTAEGVRDVVARAHCGLVLSASEGPNNAAMEYFLCGVPLVTTPSLGGRDLMYEPGHVAVVEPSPTAVEAAVAAFVARAPDPMEIRRSALAKALPHRRRMIEWLSAVAERDLFPTADDDLWLPRFCDKLRENWILELRGDGTADARRMSRPARPRSAAAANARQSA